MRVQDQLKVITAAIQSISQPYICLRPRGPSAFRVAKFAHNTQISASGIHHRNTMQHHAFHYFRQRAYNLQHGNTASASPASFTTYASPASVTIHMPSRRQHQQHHLPSRPQHSLPHSGLYAWKLCHTLRFISDISAASRPLPLAHLLTHRGELSCLSTPSGNNKYWRPSGHIFRQVTCFTITE